jgi:hypothetical protein
MKTIGCIEKIDLPQFDLNDIPSKIDTGADTSAIHCTRIVEVIENGQTHLTFWLLDDIPHKVSEFKTVTVKNSFGQREKRYKTKTNIFLFNKNYKIDVTLSDRSDMKYPVLLGKKFLKSKFLVDVSKKNLSHNLKYGINNDSSL